MDKPDKKDLLAWKHKRDLDNLMWKKEGGAVRSLVRDYLYPERETEAPRSRKKL